MTITARFCPLAKTISISIVAIVGLCISSCTTQSEFERQNGFSRNDYFGNFGASYHRDYVPGEVEHPQYYTPERRTRLGNPAREPRLSMSGGPIR